jgi:enoyl-CoA hydratase/carnithine racemase
VSDSLLTMGCHPQVKLVVMKGAGPKAFCAGGDVVSPPGTRGMDHYEHRLQPPLVTLITTSIRSHACFLGLAGTDP